MAEAIYGDVGGVLLGPEADAGLILILAGENAGEFKSYYELAGGPGTEIGIGIERGRIDYTGDADKFKSSMIYGERKKAWLGAGEIIGASVSGSWGKTQGGYVISTSISAGLSICPFLISVRFNEGSLYPF